MVVPQVRYPKPSLWRNPYVVRRRGRPTLPARNCLDCGVAIGKRSVRCRACFLGDRRPAVGPAATLDLIFRMPGATTNRCIAGIVGISPERVRQIRQEHGLRPKRNPDTLLAWPCPECGAEVKMWSSHRHQRKTAWCSPCASRLAPKPRKALLPLVCPDCGEGRIRKGRANALRAMKMGPKRCMSCYSKARRRGA